MKKISSDRLKKWAQEVLAIEAHALIDLKRRLGSSFVAAVEILISSKGRIVVTGMGKAGIVGQKFSATLSSTGTSSFWLHAAEAVHGDLGRIKYQFATFTAGVFGDLLALSTFCSFHFYCVFN